MLVPLLGAAGKDGNKKLGINIERIQCAARRRQPPCSGRNLVCCPCPAVCRLHHRCRSLLRRYWLSVGAQPSATVARLLGQAGVIPKPPPGLHRGAVKNPDKYAKK